MGNGSGYRVCDSLSQVDPLRVSPADAASIPSARPIARRVIYFGSPAVVCCDAQCSKAWGIHQRPQVSLSDDPDDTAYLADDELGEAPADPGTYEGGCAKPCTEAERLNKWCVRECERSAITTAGQPDSVVKSPDFSRRIYNQPWRHPKQIAPATETAPTSSNEKRAVEAAGRALYMKNRGVPADAWDRDLPESTRDHWRDYARTALNAVGWPRPPAPCDGSGASRQDAKRLDPKDDSAVAEGQAPDLKSDYPAPSLKSEGQP